MTAHQTAPAASVARIAPTPPDRQTTEGPRRHRAGLRPPVWFVVPAVLIYVAVVIAPNVQGFAYSFTDWDGFGAAASFVGIDNYRHVFADNNATGAIVNTFLLTLLVTIGQNVIGLLLALGLNTKVKSRYLLRLVFFLPVVLTPIVAGYLWKYLLMPEGTLNSVLGSVGLGSLQQDWLGDPDLVLYAVCAAVVWQGAGYSMVIYLAGLQAVPSEALEAAAMDGAGPVRRTWSITLPLINGAIVVNLLLTVLGNLKQFDTVFSMTSGGPSGASETMATTVYKSAFLYLQYPNALAQGVVLTLVVGVIGFFQYRLTQRKALA
ncbi:carbohydrate ABC transporter permease [Streptomyces sp. NPDC102381]|uniref:carbohydrate ABC transporter permease n=1 Tax=Streptomyces sp. NPDC102381 TaxID=3366164 RepID=UPI0038131F6B